MSKQSYAYAKIIPEIKISSYQDYLINENDSILIDSVNNLNTNLANITSSGIASGNISLNNSTLQMEDRRNTVKPMHSSPIYFALK